MLEKFVKEQFNGNREEAIKCIAYELSSLDYKKTGNMNACRKYASELTPEEKERAQEYFNKNIEARYLENKRLSQIKLSYDEVQNGKLNTNRIIEYIAVDILAIVLVNFGTLKAGLTPFFNFRTLLVAPLALGLLLKTLLIVYKTKKAMEYAQNEKNLKLDENMKKVETLIDEFGLNDYVDGKNINDLEEKGKML